MGGNPGLQSIPSAAPLVRNIISNRVESMLAGRLGSSSLFSLKESLYSIFHISKEFGLFVPVPKGE
jgi:hypothetical protein